MRDINPDQDLIGSVEISEDEILDDLLYPADHRAVRSGNPVHGRPAER